MNKQTYEMLQRLQNIGISWNDAIALRRISMTLHRWHELECGIGDHDTIYIERENGEEDGKPFLCSANTGRKWRTPDREKGAIRRLSATMSHYPDLVPYVQGDPRGAALYIMRKSDIPAGSNLDSCYSRGIAIFK